jgi:uncharacterized phage protein gp47/JayE
MTFVAQPYERFVDDLLLALTGGVTREEHRFLGTDRPYSLATPGAYGPSVRVYGQRGERFMVFEQGIDYDLDADPMAVRWRTDGGLPDDRSYFYVSYDLLTARRLTDRNAGSVTTTLAEAFGRELAVLHRQMEEIYWSAFVDSAAGSSLDHLAALLGLARKDARFASGEVLFTRGTPAPGDIAIPPGTLSSTLQGENFETTDARTLRRGQLSVVAPVRAVQEGPAGQVPAGAIVQVNRPIFGVEAVTNERQTAFATAKESDDELRRRIRGRLERAGRSTADAIRYALIEELPEVTDANVQVVEPPGPPGFVEVRLGIGDAASPDLARRVEETIFNARPVGVRVGHNLPTSTPTPSARSAAAEQGVLRGAAEVARLPGGVLDRQAEGSLALSMQVLVRLAERNLAVAQRERITDDLRARLVGYVEALPMGSDLIHAKLLAQVVEPDEVSDAILLVGTQASGERLFDDDPAVAADLDTGRLPPSLLHGLASRGLVPSQEAVSVRKRGRGWQLTDELSGQPFDVRVEQERLVVSRGFYTTNLSTHDRKARLDPGDVAVALMDEAVLLGLRVELQPRPDVDATVPPQVTPAIRKAVEDAANRVVAGSRQRLRKAELIDAIRAELGQDGRGGLQLAPGDAVGLSAEYVETGRLLSDADEVALDDNHLPNLRTLDIVVPGGLDVPR